MSACAPRIARATDELRRATCVTTFLAENKTALHRLAGSGKPAVVRRMYELTRADIASRRSNGPDAMDGDGIELRGLESRTPTANPIHASARCEEAAGAPESKHDSPEPLSQVKVAVSEGSSVSAEEESSAAGVGTAKQLLDNLQHCLRFQFLQRPKRWLDETAQRETAK